MGESKGLTEESNEYQFDPEDYMCKCFGRFTGTLCEIPYVNCGESGRCFNGGVCHIQDDSPIRTCACPRGFTGESCELKIQRGEAGLSLSPMRGSTKELVGFIVILTLIVVVIAAIIWIWQRERRKFEMLKFTYGSNDAFNDTAVPPFGEGTRSHGVLLNVI